jgi:hypothetical protein
MIPVKPVPMMLIGFGLLVIGVILPFAMVLQLLESTLFLNFLAYLTSLFGLIIGLLGVAFYTRGHRRDDDTE